MLNSAKLKLCMIRKDGHSIRIEPPHIVGHEYTDTGIKEKK